MVLNQPLTKEDFITLAGFGEKKYEDYGESIITIINNYIEENKEVEETLEETEIYKKLSQYRYKKSTEEQIKAYRFLAIDN